MFLGPDSTPTCTPFKNIIQISDQEKKNRTTPAYLNNLPQPSKLAAEFYKQENSLK